MGLKMNLRKITRNHEADPEIEFLTKSIRKPYERVTERPSASELEINLLYNVKSTIVDF